jgi:phosphatidylglycerophosphate synthase
MRRTAIAARRAGYGQIFFLARDHAAPPGIVTISNWNHLAAAPMPSQAAPLLIAPAAILSETNWLERLAETRVEPAAWAAIPQRIVMLAAAAVPDALAALYAEGGAYDFTAVQDRLTRRFGPPAAIPVGIDPMVLTTSMDVRVAEQRLLRSLVKDSDGFMARHVERPISLQIVRRLASTAVTPNQITIASAAIGLFGAPFFLSEFWLWQTVGALLFLTHSIVDGCDGELARLKFQESRWGGVLDFWGDNVVHIVTFACMAAGWSLSVGAFWPLLLGAAAALGSLGSAAFVHWRLMRIKDDSGPLFTSVSAAPDNRLARLLDAASRRDFIYLVLILALFGKSNWFLLLAALGAPIFFILLVFLALRERHPDISTRPGA